MELVSYDEAVIEFENGGEVWVNSGDYGTMPMFEYEKDEDGNPIEDDSHILKHPKSLDYGDEVSDLNGYNNYFLP